VRTVSAVFRPTKIFRHPVEVRTVEQYKKVAELIRRRKSIVAFTGAGISVESGIPAFRGGQGLWEKYDPMEYAEISSFVRQPEKVWQMLREMGAVVMNAKPSPAHRVLAAFERAGLLDAVITQNVDGLHQRAGNTKVIEYHGNHHQLVCLKCNRKSPFDQAAVETLPYPTCSTCNEPLKPDVIFFGEAIPIAALREANKAVEQCRIMMIIGTSGVVYPAAQLPFLAASNGASIIEINISETPFTSSLSHDYFEGGASEVLPRLAGELGLMFDS